MKTELEKYGKKKKKEWTMVFFGLVNRYVCTHSTHPLLVYTCTAAVLVYIYTCIQ
jgi:hypothetical protein